MSGARRRGRPETLGTVLPKVLAELGIEGATRVLRIAERWEEAVGSEIARHCRPSALRGTVLEATVDSSAWCQQIQLQRVRLLARLREVLGPEAPTDLRLRVG